MPSLSSDVDLELTTKLNLDLWLSGHYDEATKNAIRELLRKDPKELTDAFYTTLKFGTGGLRGIVGVGSNRMNVYTVRAATQGLATYLKKHFQGKIKPSVFIGYDSRLHSKLFAEEAAKVLAANDIGVYLLRELRPVPLVSFGCRWKKCQAAIMITASHNPPNYNGYKVYWENGAQVLPPHDQEIMNATAAIQDASQVKTALLTSPQITLLGPEVDAAYLKAIHSLQFYPEENKQKGAQLKVVYSNLHGTGITLVPAALTDWGFTRVHYVEKQKEPDGNFPTVTSANPEDASSLKQGIEALLETRSDLLLATDPDADRVGVTVNHKGAMISLTGNQIACLCLEHICEALTKQKKMPAHATFVTTIVSTDLFKVICEAYQVACFTVLTGFKYIGQLIEKWEQNPAEHHFIFAAEESYGYLLGTHTRDKDAITACALICEMALQAKLQGKTLVDKLNDLYKKYGVYREKLLSVKFDESKNGQEQMKAAMQRLRMHPPAKLLGTDILTLEDYKISTRIHLQADKTKRESLTLPQSDVLCFHLKDGTKLVVRPSGTEPKIKLYCCVTNKGIYGIEEGIEHCDVLADEYLKAMNLLLKESPF